VHDLVKALLEGSRDVFVHKDFPNLGCDIVLPNHIDHSHASPLCYLSSPFLEYYLDVPIENPIIL